MQMRMKGSAEWVPVGLVIAGFGLIALAWNGAASVDHPQGQIPYMISGGLSGLGLVFFGATAMVMRAIRAAQIRQTQQLETLLDTMTRLAATITLTTGTNGTGGHAQEDVPMVIAGATSFHLPDCRLVEKRDDAVRIPRTEALGTGLIACRICNP